LSYREAAKLLAEDFAIKAHFSPAPYQANEAENYPEYASDRVLLFYEPFCMGKIRCFGAIGMRWQKYDDLPDACWIMTWLGFIRMNKERAFDPVLALHFKVVSQFRPLPPLTQKMESFLKKVTYCSASSAFST